MFVGLLIASLGFGCKGKKNPEEMADMIAEQMTKKLDLNDVQKAKLDELKQEVVEKIHEAKGNHKEMKAGLLEQMKADDLDAEKIKQMIKEKHAKKEDTINYFVDRVVEFYSTLDEGQKQKVIDHLEKKEGGCSFFKKGHGDWDR